MREKRETIKLKEHFIRSTKKVEKQAHIETHEQRRIEKNSPWAELALFMVRTWIMDLECHNNKCPRMWHES